MTAIIHPGPQQSLNDPECHPMSREEEKQLFIRYQDHGDVAARETLIKANMRFVVSVVNSMMPPKHLENDLIQEGNDGLLEAVDRFEYRRGYKFISYAVWWIRQRIYAFLKHNRYVVRRPYNWHQDIAHIKEAALELERITGERADVVDIAQSMGLPEKEVGALWVAMSPEASLDKPYSEADGTPKEDLMDENPLPDAVVDEVQHGEYVRQLIDTLPNKQDADIIRLYFGIDQDPLTLEKIGTLMNLTRERIRQRRDRALSKLLALGGKTLADHVNGRYFAPVTVFQSAN